MVARVLPLEFSSSSSSSGNSLNPHCDDTHAPIEPAVRRRVPLVSSTRGPSNRRLASGVCPQASQSRCLRRSRPFQLPMPCTVSVGQLLPGEMVHCWRPTIVGVNRTVTRTKAGGVMQYVSF